MSACGVFWIGLANELATDDIENIQRQRDATRQRLHVIQRQIAHFGERWAPAHLLTERAEAQAAIEKYETVLGSAIPPGVGDELGAGGRFVLLLEEFRSLRQSVVLHGVQLSEHIADTAAYRTRHKVEHDRDRRLWIVGVILIAVVLAFTLGRLL